MTGIVLRYMLHIARLHPNARAHAAEDILRVVERVSRMRTPAYTRVQKMSQLILDEYLEPRGLREVTYREVVAETRAQCRGYYSGDIARLVASELVAEGIKVWR